MQNHEQDVFLRAYVLGFTESVVDTSCGVPLRGKLSVSSIRKMFFCPETDG